MEEKRAVIFCSANNDINPEFNELAREVVRLLCRNGYTIVSGGTIKGTMAVVSSETVRIGGKSVGIIPRFMANLAYEGLTETVWTDTMSERKEAMRKGTCLAIALPGGIGTIDELVETYVLVKLRKYPGKVVALNYNGFYDKLAAMLDGFVEENTLYQGDRDLLLMPRSVVELGEMLNLE